MWQVQWNKTVDKSLDRLPDFILEKFRSWVVSVEQEGLFSVRKLKGFHDEPLKGERKGQRSLRLNKAYRVIYEQTETNSIYIVSVLEVNKHDY